MNERRVNKSIPVKKRLLAKNRRPATSRQTIPTLSQKDLHGNQENSRSIPPKDYTSTTVNSFKSNDIDLPKDDSDDDIIFIETVERSSNSEPMEILQKRKLPDNSEEPTKKLKETMDKPKKSFDVRTPKEFKSSFLPSTNKRLGPSIQDIRSFEKVSRSNSKKRVKSGGFNLKICTFNVLCEDTKLRYSRFYTNKRQQISWSDRWNLIRKEILMLDANIFCLQEVQYDHFLELFEPLFREAGFICFYTGRDGVSDTDGCLLAYRKKVFTEIRFEHVYYNYNSKSFSGHNVGQVVLLQENKSRLLFIVANTHIISTKTQGIIKTGQMALLLATVDEFASKLDKKYAGAFLCGDFNCEPNSPLYKFIREGHLPYSRHSNTELAFSNCRQFEDPREKFEVPNNVPLCPMNCKLVKLGSKKRIIAVDDLYHSQRFLSAYRHRTEADEVEVSCFRKKCECPDFIFYSGNKKGDIVEEERIFIKKILTLPSVEDVKETCGPMPNSECGSDHFSLMAEFYVC